MLDQRYPLSVEAYLGELRLAEHLVRCYRDVPGIVQAQENEAESRFVTGRMHRPDCLGLVLHGEAPEYETEDHEGVDLFSHENVSPQNAARTEYAAIYFERHLEKLPFLVVGHEFQRTALEQTIGPRRTSRLTLIQKCRLEPHLRAHLDLLLREAANRGCRQLYVVISDLQYVRALGYRNGCFREFLRDNQLQLTFVLTPWLTIERAGAKEILEETVKIARDLRGGYVHLVPGPSI